MHPTLHTLRLRLQPPQSADAQALAYCAHHPAIAEHTRLPYPYQLADAEAWLAAIAHSHDLHWLIWAEQTLLGAIGLTARAGDVWELGYWLNPRYWRQGLASEAATAVCAWAAHNRPTQRLYACHSANNPASARVLLKLGFRPEPSEPGAEQHYWLAAQTD